MHAQQQATIEGGGHQRAICTHAYENIISIENLLAAWTEFLRGKRSKRDVQEFQADLMRNILALHKDLKYKTYIHGPYHHFRISDPKPRDIHKALVRDRLLHHALYRQLYPFFDRTFIADSYSCRINKGTHRAINRFRAFARKASRNHTETVWVLKCDIRKFFASVDHSVLLSILRTRIKDTSILWLLERIIGSFSAPPKSRSDLDFGEDAATKKGLPLGNLTSQLLVNIYMDEFDQHVKHRLKAKYYIRYADDFVVLSTNKQYLRETYRYIGRFLQERLHLNLHPNKVSIATLASGVDFLGWVHFPNHRVLRTSTKWRMLKHTKGLEKDSSTVQSYLGMLGWGNGWKLERKIREQLL